MIASSSWNKAQHIGTITSWVYLVAMTQACAPPDSEASTRKRCRGLTSCSYCVLSCQIRLCPRRSPRDCTAATADAARFTFVPGANSSCSACTALVRHGSLWPGVSALEGGARRAAAACRRRDNHPMYAAHMQAVCEACEAVLSGGAGKQSNGGYESHTCAGACKGLRLTWRYAPPSGSCGL